MRNVGRIGPRKTFGSCLLEHFQYFLNTFETSGVIETSGIAAIRTFERMAAVCYRNVRFLLVLICWYTPSWPGECEEKVQSPKENMLVKAFSGGAAGFFKVNLLFV